MTFYSEPDIASRFDRSRGMPPDVEAAWAGLIRRHAGKTSPGLTVDLGCGTGRFTGMLSATLGGTVVGIDPSVQMLAAARDAAGRLAHVHFALGRAEAVPLADASAGLVFMSMSYHHVADRAAGLRSIRRVLRPGGLLSIRTCSREALDTYVYQRFFPEARAFDEVRMPSRGELRADAAAAGFTPRAFDVVHQRVAGDAAEYRDKVALRAYSDLQAITDAQFAAGFERFSKWCATQPPGRPIVEDVDLFTFAA
jgi:ubiquinone/menaquinone biosynthesis C-methylase UbiE